MIRIYHNPGCSKSCEALRILQENESDLEIQEYLTSPPTEEELKEVLKKLGVSPTYIIRRNEPVFLDNYAGKIFDDDEWIRIMVQHPELIERPIVISPERAIIGRPPEKVLELIKKSL